MPTDAVATISGAVRSHSYRKIFQRLQIRRQQVTASKELCLSRPLCRRAVVEITRDSARRKPYLRDNRCPNDICTEVGLEGQFPLQLSREACAALAVSSLTVSVYHRPISRVPGQKEEDVLIGHAAAPLAHLFTKHSGLASWIPLVCGSPGLPAASIRLFSNIEVPISGILCFSTKKHF